MKKIVLLLTGLLVPLSIAPCWSLYTFGSVFAGVSYLQGAAIYLPRHDFSIQADKSSTALVVVPLFNLSQQTIKVTGLSADCSCVSIRDLPLEIQPRERALIPVTIGYGKFPGEFPHELVIYVQTDTQIAIPLKIVGTVH